MKKITKRILSVVLLVVIISGCSKLSDFGDTNLNPGATTDPITAALLTNVLSGIDGNSTSLRGGAYCQYVSETQYTDLSLYALPQLNSNGDYAGYLYDLENIVINNTDEDLKGISAKNGANENQIAVARILQSYIFWYKTDCWGAIPYTDALTGDPNVTFDSQETVYKGIITTLTDAVNMMVTTGAALKGDILFNGDMTKWKKFANSMRAIMALRLSNQYPSSGGYAATEFNAALNASGGVIDDNDDNTAIYPPGGNFRNNFYNTYDGRKDWAESEEMVTMLQAINDERQTVFGSSDVGVPYGLTRDDATAFTDANPDWAYVFPASYREETDPVFILTAASVYLARAEAADRGWTAEDMNAMYDAGITASHNQWDLADPTGAYLTGVALGSPAGTGANLQAIAEQQYIAFFPDGRNGWANWRRTGFPVLTPTPDAINPGGQIPRRYTYGTSDMATAKEAVEAAVAAIPGGVDSPDVPVWWENK